MSAERRRLVRESVNGLKLALKGQTCINDVWQECYDLERNICTIAPGENTATSQTIVESKQDAYV